MKFKITLKDPDGVYKSIKYAAESSINNFEELDKRELKEIIEMRRKRIEKECEPWIEYGEYVVIEIDTDKGTAIVCKS